MKALISQAGNFKYAGGKYYSSTDILNIMSAMAIRAGIRKPFRVIEPFAGSAVISITALKNGIASDVQLNDLDGNIRDLHDEIILYPERLVSKIPEIPPPKYVLDEYIRSLKSRDEKAEVAGTATYQLLPPEEWAYRKLIVQASGYQGKGEHSGTCCYAYLNTWNPYSLRRRIWQNHQILKGRVRPGKCTNHDYKSVLHNAENGIVFIDPPYPDRSARFYRKGFTQDDHAELRDIIRNLKNPYLITYSDHPLIHDLYLSQPEFAAIRVKARGARRYSAELWISSIACADILNEMYLRSVTRLPLENSGLETMDFRSRKVLEPKITQVFQRVSQ